MCLLAYSDLLPRMVHDEIMKTLETPVGQQAENFADALFRTLMPDGRNVLEVLHKEGFMKKVQAGQVIMTPTPSSQIRLDELNNILSEMSKGEDAVKRLAEMDSNSGIQAKKKDNTPARPGRDVGEPVKPVSKSTPILQAGPNEALTDEAIAAAQLSQATKMRNEAKALLAEAERLEKDTQALVAPVAKTVKTTKAKTTTTTKATANDTTVTKKAPKAKAAKV
jgi:hypothetical protein